MCTFQPGNFTGWGSKGVNNETQKRAGSCRHRHSCHAYKPCSWRQRNISWCRMAAPTDVFPWLSNVRHSCHVDVLKSCSWHQKIRYPDAKEAAHPAVFPWLSNVDVWQTRPCIDPRISVSLFFIPSVCIQLEPGPLQLESPLNCHYASDDGFLAVQWCRFSWSHL